MGCIRFLDEVFAFKTSKYVRIRDWRLGLIRVVGFCSIALYIVGYEILWMGRHLAQRDVQGVFRVQLQQPTVDTCNPYKIGCRAYFRQEEDLPYCEQFNKTYLDKRRCKYYDGTAVRMEYLGKTFLPTRVETYEMNGSFAEDGMYSFLDNSGHIQNGTGAAEPVLDYFIADLERFLILFDHSFTTQDGQLREEQNKMVGYYEEPQHQSLSKKLGIPSGMPGSTLHDTDGGGKRLRRLLKDGIGSDYRNESNQCVFGTVRKSQLEAPGGSYWATENVGSLAEVKSRKTSGRQHILALASQKKDGGKANAPKPNADKGSIEQVEKTNEAQLSKVHEHDQQAVNDEGESFGGGEDETQDAVKGAVQFAPANVSTEDAHCNVLGDVFSIGTLLSLADVSLDSEILDQEGNGTGLTRRSRGLSLRVVIIYSNLHDRMGMKVGPWWQPEPYYTYRVHLGNASKYQFRQIFSDPLIDAMGDDMMATHRSVKEFHGIQVVVEQYGFIETWSWQKLIVILTTSLGFIAFLDFMLHHLFSMCLPAGYEYAKKKYEVHEKFAGPICGITHGGHLTHGEDPPSDDGDDDDTATPAAHDQKQDEAMSSQSVDAGDVAAAAAVQTAGEADEVNLLEKKEPGEIVQNEAIAKQTD